MKKCKLLFAIVFFILCAISPIAASPVDSIVNMGNDTSARAQIDSLLSAELNLAVKKEVSRQIDGEILELKIDRISNDKLSKIQATHDGWVIGIVTILVALTGIVIPLILNQNREKKINELEKKLKDIVTIVQKSADTAEYSAKYAEFSVRLSRALSNTNVGVKIGYYTSIIKEYQQFDYVSVAYNCRGTCYHGMGKFDKAIENYTMAIERNPNFDMAYYNRGNAQAKKGLFNNAIEDYTKSLKVNPEFAIAYWSRGKMYEKIGEHQKAKDDIEKAKLLDPNLK